MPPTMPSFAELLATAVPFRVALNTQFRGVTHREGVILRGPSGWAEFAPFDDYSHVAAVKWLAAAIEQGWGQWPAPVRTSVPVNAIIPAVDADRASTLVADAVVRGCTTIKVKVAGVDSAHDDDVARLRAVRAALDSAGVADGQIRIDVNTGWSVEDAKRFLPVLAEAADGLEYVEQPCSSLVECAEVKALGIAPVAIDEGIRLAADLDDADVLREISAAADVVILKPIPLGGVSRLLQLAERLQRPAVVSSSMDTSVGLAAGIAAAAALPQLQHACGLGTGALLAKDVCVETTVPVEGALDLTRPIVDEELLEQRRLHADDPRHDFWLTRLAAAAAALGIAD